MRNDVKQAKSGYKTTEFWLTLLAVILPAVEPFMGDMPSAYKAIGLAIAGLSALGYTASRTSVKNNLN